MNNMSEIVSRFTLGEPAEFEDLRLYPILGDLGDSFPLMELDQAIQEGLLTITEVSEAGSVPNLSVNNSSKTDVLILDGEELVGAKQNRIVNVTVIVPALSVMIIPVTCVEQGRWGWKGRSFRSGGSVVHPSLRQAKYRQVTANLRENLSFASDQGSVWESISAKSARLGIHSPTSSLHEVEERALPDDEDLLKRFPKQRRQLGYLAYIRNGFAGADVLGSAELLDRKYRKYLRSCYLDAQDPGIKFPSLDPQAFLEGLQSAALENVASLGKGMDYRFETNRLLGGLTLLEGTLVHLTVFPSETRFRRFFRW